MMIQFPVARGVAVEFLPANHKMANEGKGENSPNQIQFAFPV